MHIRTHDHTHTHSVIVNPMWKLESDTWSIVARYLDSSDVARFSLCCKLASIIAHKVTGAAPYTFARGVNATSAGQGVKNWPNLTFNYRHEGDVAALTQQALASLAGVETLVIVNATDLTTAAQFEPAVSTICRAIEIVQCNALTDIAQLAGCRHVSLRECASVRKVAALSGCEEVILEGCPDVATNDILFHPDNVPR